MLPGHVSWYLQRERQIYNWLSDMFGDQNHQWMTVPGGWVFTDEVNAGIFLLAWGQIE